MSRETIILIVFVMVLSWILFFINEIRIDRLEQRIAKLEKAQEPNTVAEKGKPSTKSF